MSYTKFHDLPLPPKIHKVFHDKCHYDKNKEILYVEALVDDSIPKVGPYIDDEISYDPGRCWAEIFWPFNDAVYGPPNSTNIELYCKTNGFIEWTLIPFGTNDLLTTLKEEAPEMD